MRGQPQEPEPEPEPVQGLEPVRALGLGPVRALEPVRELARVPGQEAERAREPVRGLEQERAAGPRWRRRSLWLQWQGSRRHRASTIRWCRFSRPDRRCHSSSCRRIARQQRLPEPPRRTTLPLY